MRSDGAAKPFLLGASIDDHVQAWSSVAHWSVGPADRCSWGSREAAPAARFRTTRRRRGAALD